MTLVRALVNFMNKFHLVKHPGMASQNSNVDQFARENKSKVVLFKSADAYAQKIIQSLNGTSSNSNSKAG